MGKDLVHQFQTVVRQIGFTSDRLRRGHGPSRGVHSFIADAIQSQSRGRDCMGAKKGASRSSPGWIRSHIGFRSLMIGHVSRLGQQCALDSSNSRDVSASVRVSSKPERKTGIVTGDRYFPVRKRQASGSQVTTPDVSNLQSATRGNCSQVPHTQKDQSQGRMYQALVADPQAIASSPHVGCVPRTVFFPFAFHLLRANGC